MLDCACARAAFSVLPALRSTDLVSTSCSCSCHPAALSGPFVAVTKGAICPGNGTPDKTCVQMDTLLHLHDRAAWTAKGGAAGDPRIGSRGPKRARERVAPRPPPLEVPVPLGTIVKDRKGRVIAELTQVRCVSE